MERNKLWIHHRTINSKTSTYLNHTLQTIKTLSTTDQGFKRKFNHCEIGK